MKILLPTLFAVLALCACDRRATQPPEQSTTTDTATATPAPATATPTDAPAAVPAPIVTESCDDLSGQAQTDCLERNRVRAKPPAMPPRDTDGEPSPPAA
ncbi:hypothetical protein ACFQZQ_06340 [Lysobacter koreensis]|uniref:Uncharacterized protein n=1 Tax=Lysobacter koreensis TaxID=266122 RepID=A0ABW2YKD6_9GAMM